MSEKAKDGEKAMSQVACDGKQHMDRPYKPLIHKPTPPKDTPKPVENNSSKNK